MFKIEQNRADCPASTPWAVVREQDGQLMGCHSDEQSANRQLEALQEQQEADQPDEEVAQLAAGIAQLANQTVQEDTPEGLPDEEDPESESDGPPFQLSAGPFQPWTGVLAIEGKETGDGREFSAGSLEWGAPPQRLLWQRSSEPQHGHSVVVGRIDRIQRIGDEIRGWGVIDLGIEEGAEVARQIDGGLAGGISVDVDSIKETDVELVFPPDDSDEERIGEDDEVVMLFGPPPEKVVFHRGRIRGATLVAIPAFVDAQIWLIDDEQLQAAISNRFGAVGPHDTGASDAEWDGAENEARLPSPMSVDTARASYAWMAPEAVEDGEVRKTDLRFIHHNVSADGQPGAANINALTNAIGVLNGGRGGTTIPNSDRQGVYNHLAQHLRDAGREPPELLDLDQAVVASGGPMYPPMAWFQNPDLHAPCGTTILEDGRLFAHLALWGTCHTTFADRCVTPPKEGDFPYFAKREIETQEGELVGIGQITLGTGHAPLRMGAAPAADHYDNTGSAVADIAVGEDRWGIWVAGALRPNVSEMQVRELRAASLSGDWRRIGGKLRLVAVLAVNVPGYPIPRMRASMSADQMASMVAAGIPTDHRRERYRRQNAETLADGTIRVRRASLVSNNSGGTDGV